MSTDKSFQLTLTAACTSDDETSVLTVQLVDSAELASCIQTITYGDHAKPFNLSADCNHTKLKYIGCNCTNESYQCWSMAGCHSVCILWFVSKYDGVGSSLFIFLDGVTKIPETAEEFVSPSCVDDTIAVNAPDDMCCQVSDTLQPAPSQGIYSIT